MCQQQVTTKALLVPSRIVMTAAVLHKAHRHLPKGGCPDNLKGYTAKRLNQVERLSFSCGLSKALHKRVGSLVHDRRICCQIGSCELALQRSPQGTWQDISMIYSKFGTRKAR